MFFFCCCPFICLLFFCFLMTIKIIADELESSSETALRRQTASKEDFNVSQSECKEAKDR